MNSIKDYNWKFEDITSSFDEHVRKSVPLYEHMHENTSNIAKYFIRNNSDVIDIGTSTGYFIKTMHDLGLKRNVNYIGVDIEESMIQECAKRHKDKNISFIHNDAINVDYSKASFVSLILTLQFMELPNRKVLLSKIHSQISEGSAIFIIEKIRTSNLLMHDIYNDLYYDFKQKQGFSGDEIIQKNKSLRGIMKPLTMQHNLGVLNEIGFVTDIVFKFNNFVGIIAIKGDKND